MAMTFKQAAIRMLRERGPMHYNDLAQEIIAAGLVKSEGKTPGTTLNAMIAVDIKRNAADSAFVRIKPGVLGLRDVHGAVASSNARQTPIDTDDLDAGQPASEPDSPDQRVRTPLYPVYSEVRHLLRVWPGRDRKQITGLRATVNTLRGTPQNTVDWTDPAEWIPKRLSGADRELAETIWRSSGGAVNPRHVYGHWLLVLRYDLLREMPSGQVELTAVGKDFLDNPGGETEAAIDEAEGLIKLLSLIADIGPVRVGGLRAEWADYLERRSRFGSASTIRDTLRRRLVNLRARALVERNGSLYSVTPAGLDYLARVGDEDRVSGEDLQIQTLVREQESTIRETLHELLFEMDPFAFEHLVKRLLEEMDYQNVEVTARGGDGGVDVVADIELGITSVREVVQVKNHKRAVQRKDLDALRGSLYRFNAVRGTIVTTSRFARGTKEAAFATGAAPITLIDGKKLIDLLIEHGIGVRKRTIELLEVDPTAFSGEDLDS